MDENNTKNKNTKEIILKAALKCFNQKGYVNTTMNDIVETSGVSKGGIYWYFKSKEEIFAQMIEAGYAEWLDVLNKELPGLPNPIEKLKKFGELFYSVIEEPVWRLLPESYWGEMGEHYRDRLNICYDKDDEILRDIFTEAVEKDLLKYEDPQELTWIYISMLEGMFAKLTLGFAEKEVLERYFDTAIEIFIDSIKK